MTDSVTHSGNSQTVLFPKNYYFILFLETEEGREIERKGNISVNHIFDMIKKHIFDMSPVFKIQNSFNLK